MEHGSRAEPEAALHRRRTEEAAEAWKSPPSFSFSLLFSLPTNVTLITRASPLRIINKKAISVGVGPLNPSVGIETIR